MNIARHATHRPTPISALPSIFLPVLLPHKPAHHRQRRQISDNSLYRANYAHDTAQQPSPPQDVQISAPLVQLVSPETNTLLPPEPPSTILSRIDRNQYSLVQVSQSTSPPVVRIFSKLDLANRERLKEKLSRPSAEVVASSKRLELNWSVSDHDLGHKLKQLRNFLESGRRVEVAFKPKRKQDFSSDVQKKGLIDRIRVFVMELEGGKEWKAAAVNRENARVITFFFEAKNLKVNQEAVERKERQRAKKEALKPIWRKTMSSARG